METKPQRRDATLKAFVESEIESDIAPSITPIMSPRYRSRLRRAVQLFSEFLGRPAELADLTEKNVQQFGEWLAAYRSKDYCYHTKTSLRAIWRFAASLGVADDLPSREMTPGTVSHFMETSFLPQSTADNSGGYHTKCRRAVDAFSEFLERPALLSDLTSERVREFAKWLASPTVNHGGRSRWIELRSIWRSAAKLGLAEEIDSVFRNPRSAPPPDRTPGTLSNFFETVYLPQRLVGASKASVANIRSRIRQFNVFVGHSVRLDELNDSLLASFLNDRLEMDLRKATINGIRGDITAVWRYAATLGLVEHAPGIRKLRAEHDEPDSWSEDEFRRILTKCNCLSSQPAYDDVPATAVMRAVLLLAYWTGLRRGTLWKLKWTEVDLVERWVTVPGNIMKGRRGKKFRFGEDALEALRAVQRVGAVTVLPAVDWNRFYKEFDSVLEAAGIQPSKRRGMSKLHKVRRTTATMVAVRQGLGAASSLLGHSSEQITLRYIDPSKLAGNDMTGVLPSLSCSGGAT